MNKNQFKIVVGYDGSKSALKTLEVARQYAKAFNAKVHIIKSRKTGTIDEANDIDKEDSALEEAKALFAEDCVECETHLAIRGNSPGEDIVQFAEKFSVDAAFVGVKMKSKVGKMIFSSNAQYVVLNAPCPVITVK